MPSQISQFGLLSVRPSASRRSITSGVIFSPAPTTCSPLNNVTTTGATSAMAWSRRAWV